MSEQGWRDFLAAQGGSDWVVHWLSHPPAVNLSAMLLGLPIVAYLGGYLLAGRAASAIARQPLD